MPSSRSFGVLLCVCLFLSLSRVVSGGAKEPETAEDAATRRLLDAARSGEVAEAKAALADGARINEKRRAFSGSGLQTPLMAAVLHGNFAIVDVLLAAGADATLGEKDGFTPLHGAAFQGRARIARALFKHGKAPNEMHKGDGNYPAHRATWGKESRYTDTLQVFLDNGVDPRLKNRDGKTLLESAMEAGNERTIALLRRALEETPVKPAKADDEKAPIYEGFDEL